MKKLQSFMIRKFSSSRLKEQRYKLEITFQEAKKNNEIIRLGDSELLRKLRKLKGKEFSQEELDRLLNERKKVERKKNSSENRKRIFELNNRIDELLFEPDLISVYFSDVRHYSKIIKSGLFINGKQFYRLYSGAGNARRSSAIFASEDVWNELSSFLDCGRDLDYEINPQKFSAYQALASSATIPVSKPIFAVLPDKEVETENLVDFFIEQEYGIDPTFEERLVTYKKNLFDGQGIISVEQARIWADELGCDYVPSAFIFRGAYAKGLLVTLDFHKLAHELGVSKITDIYGVEHWIDDEEILLSQSQFKLAGGFTNLDYYNCACKENGFGWGVSRVAPKKDKTTTTSCYQYIQALDSKKVISGIEEISNKTISWAKDISQTNREKSLLFLLGENVAWNGKWFDKTQMPIIKSLILEEKTIDDPHFRKIITRLANKKIKESYMGSLIVDGNYQFVISDPYAQTCHFLGINDYALEDSQHYSQYWNKRDVEKVACFRSPTTYTSEPIKLQFCENDKTRWFEYLNSGIVINIFGDDAIRLSGCDFDGDLVMTTPDFYSHISEKLPIPYYERKSAPKTKINKNELWASDSLSFNTKIGLVTNYGTTAYTLMSFYDKGTLEYEALLERLKSCNIFQGHQIDLSKGIEVTKLPDWWNKWNKIADDDSDEIKERKNLYNRILLDKRSYFMRYVYSHYNRKYKRNWDAYDNLCRIKLGIGIQELLKKQGLSEQEEKIIREYERNSPLIDTKSPMNILCHYLENEIKEMKLSSKKVKFDYTIYQSRNCKISTELVHKMTILYKEWISHQKTLFNAVLDDFNDENERTEDNFDVFLREKAYRTISSNSSELADLAIETCYGGAGTSNKNFAWDVFGNEIVGNLLDKSSGWVEVPMPDECGSIEYLGKRYSKKIIGVEGD